MPSDEDFFHPPLPKVADNRIKVIRVCLERAINELARVFLLAVEVETKRGKSSFRKPVSRLFVKVLTETPRKSVNGNKQRPSERAFQTTVDRVFLIDSDPNIFFHKPQTTNYKPLPVPVAVPVVSESLSTPTKQTACHGR